MLKKEFLYLTGNIKDFIYLSTNFLRAQYDITLRKMDYEYKKAPSKDTESLAKQKRPKI